MSRGEKEESNLDDVNIFVKYLPSGMGEGGLRTLFSSFGPIVSAKLMVDSQGESLGYGFVRFAFPSDASLAVKEMDGFSIANKRLLCKLSDHSIYPRACRNIYIKPLPSTTKEEELVRLFLPFGEIFSAKVVHRTSKMNIGFVRYRTLESATAAVENMSGYKLGNCCLTVKYAKSGAPLHDDNVQTQRHVSHFCSGNASPASPPQNCIEYYPAYPPIGYYVLGFYNSYSYMPMFDAWTHYLIPKPEAE